MEIRGQRRVHAPHRVDGMHVSRVLFCRALDRLVNEAEKEQWRESADHELKRVSYNPSDCINVSMPARYYTLWP